MIQGIRLRMLSIFMLLAFLLTGCSPGTAEPEEQGNRETLENIYFVDVTAPERLEFRDLYYGVGDSSVIRFEAGADGAMYLLCLGQSGQNIFLKVKDGKEYRKIPEAYYGFMYLDDSTGYLYLYNIGEGRLEEWNTDFEYIRDVVTGFMPFEIKEMAAYDGRLFALCVEDDPYQEHDDELYSEENGYIDYGEKLYSISLKDGTLKEIEAGGIITMCDQGLGFLYLYSYRDESYFLDVYDITHSEVTYSLRTDDIGYVFSIAVAGEKIYFISLDSTGLCSYDIKTGEMVSEVSSIGVYSQSDFETEGRYLIFFDRTKREICSFDTVTGNITAENGDTKKRNSDCDVIIGTVSSGMLPFSIGEISQASGLSVGTYESPVFADYDFGEQLALKFIAGDPDVDIYILRSSIPYMGKLKRDGVCYPLNASSAIMDENGRFFRGISDYFKTDSGNVWGIPIATAMNVLAVFPENLKRTGLSSGMFKDYPSMMGEIRCSGVKEGIFIWGIEYGTYLFTNYMTNNEKISYDTPLFRDYFTSMWDGWRMYDDFGYANNPYLGKALDRITDGDGERLISAVENAGIINPESTLFNMVSEEEVLAEGFMKPGMEIYPLPLISGEYSRTMYITTVAVVNPNGRNREKAVRLMEAISESLRTSGRLGVVYENLGDYPEDLDTERECFKELYDINRAVRAADYGMINDYVLNDIPAYQRGEIDIDAAIRSMQRKEDAYRNE